MAPISIPTTAPLPPTLRLDPSNITVLKVLNRLTRQSLLALVLDWLDDANVHICAPYLRSLEQDEDDQDADLYPPLPSLGALRAHYKEMQTTLRGSKRAVLDRILEGDWRRGLTLYQLAMADLQYLYDNPNSQTWSAYHIRPLKIPTPQQAAEHEASLKLDAKSLVVPRFHPSTFLANLQAQVLPDVKAHYNFDRPKDLAVLLLRIFILDSPYNTNLATTGSGADSRSKPSGAMGFDASRTIYIAFPDGSPHIYISKPQSVGITTAAETRSLLGLVVEGIPKALSRPRERFALKTESLTTRNLNELLHRQGAGRTNAAGGGWSVYADEKKKESPLDAVLPSPPLSETADEVSESVVGREIGREKKRAASPDTRREENRAKRARVVAQARFGESARVDDGRGVERVDIVIDDPFPETAAAAEEEDENEDAVSPRGRGVGHRHALDEAFNRARGEPDDDDGGAGGDGDDEDGAWRPSVKLTFHGPHVFAGIRQLVEAGIIDGEKMPGWLTGEEGVTIGAVRHGRIRGHKGSGL